MQVMHDIVLDNFPHHNHNKIQLHPSIQVYVPYDSEHHIVNIPLYHQVWVYRFHNHNIVVMRKMVPLMHKYTYVVVDSHPELSEAMKTVAVCDCVRQETEART